ncbi:MAG TPA: YtxH domain-containing protein [Actinomycetota bacterium]
MAGFKRGMIVGLGVGYVLGARAGRQRYEEIKRAWEGFMGNPSVQHAFELGKGAVGSGVRESLHAVHGGVEKAAGAVKERLGDGNGSDAPPRA